VTDKAKPSVLIDNDKVKVADWCMGPDTQIDDHVHASDYLVVPLSLGELTIATADGNLDFPMEIGTAFFGAEGDAHDVLNRGNAEVRFLEIHIK
jgi:hypothetical protein